MITFLPSPNFLETALWLDNKRLGCQRKEAKQILDILQGNKVSRWARHPAVQMWVGYEEALAYYGETLCLVWKDRGFVDNLRNYFSFNTRVQWKLPPWMSVTPIHSSHRAALLFKDPKWYGQFGWSEKPKIDYFWPKRETNNALH